MHTATVTLVSMASYSQSRPHNEPKLNKEAANDYEARTWHNRIHQDSDGVVIPPMVFKNCLAEAAKFLSKQIPGKGKSTYTKHFEAGILVTEPVKIIDPITGKRIVPPSEDGLKVSQICNKPEITEAEAKFVKEFKRASNEVWGDWIFTPSDGVPGSGKRVWRCYPMIDSWRGTVTFQIIDDVITQDVFQEILAQAGLLIGIGRFRVRNRGLYGQFRIESLDWQKLG